jgi:hypothetical protein
MAGVFRAVFQQWQILGAKAARQSRAEDFAAIQVGLTPPQSGPDPVE